MSMKSTTTKACLFGGALLTAGVANAQFTNGGFETGDFTGWTAIDTQSSPFFTLTVNSSSLFGSPSEGAFQAYHGFDGSGGLITIAQDVNVDGRDLVFDWAAYAYMVPFGATLDREFNVNIREVGSGSLLQSTNVYTAVAGAANNTGVIILDEVVDVSAFEGQFVTVEFEWTVPESFTGPGAATLDDVRFENASSFGDAGACCLNGFYCVATLQSACEGAGGVFLGTGSVCATSTCPGCVGDLNGDGETNVFDFADLAADFGCD
jgi:hypothetical protein